MAEQRSGFKIGGYFTAECFSPDGVLKWKEVAKNYVTDTGIHAMLEIIFEGATQYNHYVSIFKADDSISTASAVTDIGTAIHEVTTTTDVNGAERPTYVCVATNKQVTNSASKASFVFAAARTIYGAMLVLKESTFLDAVNGTLTAIAKFTTAQAVGIGDTLLVTYTIDAADV